MIVSNLSAQESSFSQSKLKLQGTQLQEMGKIRKELGISNETPLLFQQKGEDWMPAGPGNFVDAWKMSPLYIPDGINNSLYKENQKLRVTVEKQTEIIKKLKEVIVELNK